MMAVRSAVASIRPVDWKRQTPAAIAASATMQGRQDRELVPAILGRP